ncbi:biotin--protein ligase [Thioalkalivibrio denitrificans]|uniref:Biotin--protein ligase n=1 Tax=Thioalkalivibrio denitrificans TaxID=108003 RepID=A0A1V3NFW1_9GAMM|nr:lipoate--protein ligase family protein [Thioalkalivibrio denitrificans]OOG23813.1 biotin--protein ligase [Thioalkalivibrio denitrificans]
MPTLPTQWHWLDLGELDPLDLHAAYTGVARAMGPDDRPVVLWARPAQAHVSVGASQYPDADLDLERCEALGVPVIRRPLGGGTVWLDGDQECFVFIVPARRVPGGHRGLFDLCLGLVSDWFQGMGLPVQRMAGRDLWVGDRKILGSGAATEGKALVLGASVLRHFPFTRFAECIRAPGPGFRQWLVEALEAGMTDWRSQGIDPDTGALQAGLRDTARHRLGWTFSDGNLSDAARDAITAAREELAEPLEEGGGRRHVPDGIRINGRCYLVERSLDGGWLRLLLDDGRIGRAAAADPQAHAALQACVGEPVQEARILGRLAGRVPGAHAERLAGCICALYESIPP